MDHRFTMSHAYDDRLVSTVVPAAPGQEVSTISSDLVPQIASPSLGDASELASSTTSPYDLGDS